MKLAPDLARAREVIASRGCRLGEPLHIASETGSTNDDAKAGAREGAPHGSVWLAETQTRGRGRQGRTWISPPGENLLFSVLLRIPCAPARVPPISLVCGLAVRDAVAKVLSANTKRRVLVKWPNDVVVCDEQGDPPLATGGRVRGPMQKIAGILVESSLSGAKVEHVIVGIGVNVHTRDFPDDLSGAATSIALEGGTADRGDRAEVLADILQALDHDVEHVAHRGLGLVHARLSAHDALAGREVEGENLRGVACGMDVDGRLLVRTTRDGEDVIVPVASGEVRLRTF